MNPRAFFLAGTLALSVMAANAASRDYIAIVGSSTVYPFATVVAETFGKTTDSQDPENRIYRFGWWF